MEGGGNVWLLYGHISPKKISALLEMKTLTTGFSEVEFIFSHWR
jgi:hypothetical protein